MVAKGYSRWLACVGNFVYESHIKAEVSGDSVVTVHGNGGGGILVIGNGAHIAGPLDKVVAQHLRSLSG